MREISQLILENFDRQNKFFASWMNETLSDIQKQLEYGIFTKTNQWIIYSLVDNKNRYSSYTKVFDFTGMDNEEIERMISDYMATLNRRTIQVVVVAPLKKLSVTNIENKTRGVMVAIHDELKSKGFIWIFDGKGFMQFDVVGDLDYKAMTHLDHFSKQYFN